MCCVQGLQINEINVNLLQNTLNLADIKLCIAYMHTKKPLSYLFRKWNMLHWIKGRHCEFYITYITQALLISDNKCSFFASQQTMKKFFWSQSFLYPSIQYNHWFRRKHKYNWFDYTRTFSKDFAKTNFTIISYIALLRVYFFFIISYKALLAWQCKFYIEILLNKFFYIK